MTKQTKRLIRQYRAETLQFVGTTLDFYDSQSRQRTGIFKGIKVVGGKIYFVIQCVQRYSVDLLQLKL